MTLKEAHDYIKKTPALMSLLYDMDLMPEQVDEDSLDHRRMIILAEAWKVEHKHRRLPRIDK